MKLLNWEELEHLTKENRKKILNQCQYRALLQWQLWVGCILLFSGAVFWGSELGPVINSAFNISWGHLLLDGLMGLISFCLWLPLLDYYAKRHLHRYMPSHLPAQSRGQGRV